MIVFVNAAAAAVGKCDGAFELNVCSGKLGRSGGGEGIVPRPGTKCTKKGSGGGDVGTKDKVMGNIHTLHNKQRMVYE